MRTAEPIWNLWEAGGPFIGENKPSGIVTVEWDWKLATSKAGGNLDKKKLPIRSFQACGPANLAAQMKVPNVQSIAIDSTIDADADTCTISMYNQKMKLNTGDHLDLEEVGTPGYFSPSFGLGLEEQARWRSHTPNDWVFALTPNSLIRTYQGYGGNGDVPESQDWRLALQEDLDGKHLLQTGTWLVDRVRMGTDGMIQLECRSMAKLLLDQQLYPPLVPRSSYPLSYSRYVWKNETHTRTVSVDKAGPVNLRYHSTANTAWYDGGVVHGHQPGAAFDGNDQTYWYSVGNAGPHKPYATEWVQADAGNQYIDEVTVHPWAGNYQCLEGDTKVIVKGEGRIPISELAGREVEVLTRSSSAGKWVKAPIRSFGRQKIYELTVKRNGERKVIGTTHGHRWLTKNYKGDNRVLEERLTTELKAGDSLDTVMPANNRNTEMSSFGIAAGLVFGDGTKTKQGARVDLFGGSRDLVDHFGPSAQIREYIRTPQASDKLNCTDQPYTQVDGLPFFMKDAPSLGENVNYLYGWLAGYFAADGHVTEKGHSAIVSARRENLELVQAVADRCGIGTLSIREYATNSILEGSSETYYRLTFIPETLKAEFFLLPLHNERWSNHYAGKEKFNSRYMWTVESVVETDRVEEVYCAVVPGTHTFVLDGYIHTGNCYISIHDGNGWHDEHGGDLIPYEPLGVGRYRPTYEPSIPYVAKAGCPWETKFTIKLPRAYKAKYVRFTFTNLHRSPHGTYPYRAGMREGTARLSTDVSKQESYQKQVRYDGNMKDYSDIIKDLLLWSGFWCRETLAGNESPQVRGRIETTGAWPPEALPPDLFDKRPVIDPITEIRQIVGYMFWIGPEGEANFRAPNFWSAGNYDENGFSTDFIPHVDERVQLTDMSVMVDGQDLRSEIIVASADPTQGAGLSDMVVTRYTPPGVKALRGMVVPAMWVNGYFTDKKEQKLMAETIAMHSFFASRQASVTCFANPCIGIDDQIRIFERNTATTYIHYVRGVNTSMDLDSGEYNMSLTTHWLGTPEADWGVEDRGN